MHPKCFLPRTTSMMKKEDFREVFEIKPKEGLSSRVFSRISTEKSSILKRKQFFAGFSFLLSILALIPTTIYVVNQFRNSGFYSYLSLFWEGNVISYWKDLLMILAESLPVYSILLFLSVIFVFLVSGFFVIKNKKNGFYFYQYA